MERKLFNEKEIENYDDNGKSKCNRNNSSREHRS